MIRLLNAADTPRILDFSYQREKENLFVIGSLDKKVYANPFKTNHYFGYFLNNKLAGIAVYFGKHKSLTVNADGAEREIIFPLIDAVVEADLPIQYIPVFKKYGIPMMERLKEKHGKTPMEIREETVYILTHKNFQDFSQGGEERGMEKDLDEIIRLEFVSDRAEDYEKPITQMDRERVNLATEFFVRVDGKIVSKANIHGISKQYFQIGGVGTLPECRGKGYAKRAVSALCKHFFSQGIGNALLFTANTNEPAKRVYGALGFQPDEAFIIAKY